MTIQIVPEIGSKPSLHSLNTYYLFYRFKNALSPGKISSSEISEKMASLIPVEFSPRDSLYLIAEISISHQTSPTEGLEEKLLSYRQPGRVLNLGTKDDMLCYKLLDGFSGSDLDQLRREFLYSFSRKFVTKVASHLRCQPHEVRALSCLNNINYYPLTSPDYLIQVDLKNEADITHIGDGAPQVIKTDALGFKMTRSGVHIALLPVNNTALGLYESMKSFFKRLAPKKAFGS